MKTDPIEIIKASNSWQQFEQLLSELGDSPNFKKVKGDAFEYLTKFFLQTDPLYITTFEKIFHHSEIPIPIRDELNLPSREVGIDLVAKCKDGTYYAIQCKFHQDKQQNISYDEVSTFFSVTERPNTYSKLKYRIISTSTYKASKNIKQLHPEKLSFLMYSDFAGMDKQRFKQIHQIIKGEEITFKPPLEPRAHQTLAVSKAYNYFTRQNMDRGKIIHPCGTGKSLTAYWAAKKLKVNNVLIAVPSLALVKQTLDVWLSQALADRTTIDFIAVCSDKDIGNSDTSKDTMDTHDIGIPVTTDSNEIHQFLNSKSPNMKIIITTYQSGEAVISASQTSNFKFDLGIFDEAHKTTGDKTKKFAQLLQDDKICITKKIFMTATERYFSGDTPNIISMDDESIYGKVIDQLSFRSALLQEPPILSDYEVVTILVTKKDIENIISDNQLAQATGKDWTFREDGATIAALIAHRKLSKDTNIKHAISFHKNIKRAKAFKDLSNYLNDHSDDQNRVLAFHVNSKMGNSKRIDEIERFGEKNPSIITNARCLTEGVDIPIVDAVVFADPKQSKIDIVQAAGRAMRTHPKKSLGYIIIPVIVDEESSDKINDAFRQIVNVIAALGVSDDRIIDELKEMIRSEFKISGKILKFEEYTPVVQLELTKVIENIKLKLWDRVSFAKSVIGESGYKKYLDTQTALSESTKTKYTSAIRKISNDCIRNARKLDIDLNYSSLEEITDTADLKKLKDKYFSIEEFRDLDERGHNMYSAGFNSLIKYQEFKKAN